MQIKFFSIPLHGSKAAGEELNGFLRGNRIVSVEREFVADGQNSQWAFCISYLDHENRPFVEKKGKIDYREVLSEPEFSVYASLRTLRKSLAEQEGLPPYAIFNNQQLAAMVEQRVTTLQAMQSISGVGQSRIEKYGKPFLAILSAEIPQLISKSEQEQGNEKK